MRFTVAISGLDQHRTAIRRELEVIDELIAAVTRSELDALRLSSGSGVSTKEIVADLTRLRESIFFRYTFLQDVIDEVQQRVRKDEEIAHELDGIFSQLEGEG